MNDAVVLLLLVALGSVPRLAEPANTAPDIDDWRVSPEIKLADVLDKALLRAPQQAVLAAAQSSADAKTTVANSYLSASPSVSVYHQNDTFTSARNERDWMVQVALPLWMPNEKLQAQQVAQLSTEQLALNHERLRLWVAGQLRSALWDVAANQALLALYEQKHTDMQRIEAVIAKNYQAGELAKTELMLVKQATLQVQQEVLDAQAELMHAHYAYTQLTGLQEMPAKIEEAQSTLDSFETSAQWQFAEASLAMVERERKLVALQRKSRPQLMLNARSSRGAFDAQYNQSLGVQFQIPLDTAVSRAPRLAHAQQAIGEVLAPKAQPRFTSHKALHVDEQNLLDRTQAFAQAAQERP